MSDTDRPDPLAPSSPTYPRGAQNAAAKTAPPASPPEQSQATSNFVEEIVLGDVQSGKHDGRVQTRFPPEPNGYLHIGHAKSICLNFGLAAKFGGKCNLRMDDTNPSKEDVEYVESIQQDVRWLGFDWGERLFHASDYFEPLHRFAVRLIEDGKAYVCELSAEQIREHRGTLTEPGRNSPHRDRPIQESLDRFERMRQGELAEGTAVLRAKIDMASPNLNLRDPVIYRIRHARHDRTADTWCIYPMYDYAHCVSDALEGITHSICTLEFEDHRPLYDWFLDQLPVPCHPQQIEFARLNLSYTVMSKRKLLRLVEEGHVNGWNDPRMPTIVGLRRRGFTPEALRDFAQRVGVAKRDSMVDVALLEHCVREDLNRRTPRMMGVLRPLRVVVENFPEGEVEWLEAPLTPEDPAAGSRKVPFSRVLYIDQDDFREEPPPKYWRLAPGREVRLRYGYFLKCVGVTKDEATGEVTELRCTYDPATRSGSAPDGRKVRVTLHWVSAAHAVEAEVRLYDRLFTTENPADERDGQDFTTRLNPQSLEVLRHCRLEPALGDAEPGSLWQFERLGYFCADSVDSKPGALVFNRTVTLKDAWTNIQKKKPG